MREPATSSLPWIYGVIGGAVLIVIIVVVVVRFRRKRSDQNSTVMGKFEEQIWNNSQFHFIFSSFSTTHEEHR